ncbi:MAG: glycoside hydrolase domain-containing protein [Thomasclavelia spiroformis]|uniref:glycoside hydrolase domain-containing protein n=2 Tax=Thomasclavelia spiroformis TaxID=29348 RepID=UPI00399286FC
MATNGLNNKMNHAIIYAYMFDFSGRPDLTQKYARQTLLESYFDDTSGQLGNDDCGQMSAWYVFSAMGFYPVNPASGEYMIGSPIFDKVTINNPKTDTQFVITANNNDDNETNANCYIQDATLNGEALNIPVITYNQITSGGNVEFNMNDTPSSWASDYHKEAIQYDEDAQSPEDDSEPPFFGNSEVTRVTGKNYASKAKVSTTDYGQPGGDIDVPSVSLIDGNYDTGYVSANVHSNEDLSNTPYYLTMEWDNPLSRVTSFKIWSNYRGNQNPTKMDIEIKDSSSDQWKVIVEDWTPEWKDESGGDNRCSANIKFNKALKDIIGLRIRIKEANFTWGKIAVRELELFEDYSQIIEISNPSDYVANIKYNRNTLEKVLFNGKELVENEDYAFSRENNNRITVFGTSLVKDGVDSSAKLEFVFSQGDSYVETLIIWDGWKAHLESLVEKAEAIDTSIYTSASVDNLNEAINEAKSIIDKEDASDEELEAASNKLNEAIEGLVVDTFRGSIMNDPSLKVSANGQANENEGPEKAIDADLNTKWSCRYQYADDGKFWMEMDFDKKYAVNGLIFIGAATENSSYLTKEFSLQVKENGEWKDVYTLKDIEENEVKVTLDEPIMGSQFRLVIPKLSDTDSANARVYEFHLLGNVLADKTALGIAIDLANAITDEDLANVVPAVADEFIAARDEANAVYNNTSASQVEVNNVFDRLANVMHMLDFKQGDKTALKAFIDKVSGLEADKYIQATWTAFETELNEANAVYNDENAMQEEINTAYSELVTAFLNLRLIPDKSLLEDLINQANGLNGANYTKATFDGLTKALDEAKAVFDNPNASQVEVDNAKDVLAKALAGLQTITTDNTVSTPVNNGDTTSVKTGDESLVGMFATIALLSVAGYAALKRKD